MKKLLMLALCMGMIVPMSGQVQALKDAKKMAGKDLAGARELLKQAMQNEETKNNVETYYIAGKIEFDAFDKANAKRMVNPNDPAVNAMDMNQQLLNGYNFFQAALPLDSLPNAKGEVKPKYSKEMIGKINGNVNNYFQAGAEFFNEKKYYPEAYDAFMIYGKIHNSPHADKVLEATPDSVIATAFFNAGLAAYSGNHVKESAEAFRLARKNKYPHPESYIYEIACWQNMMQSDSTLVDAAKANIADIAMAGYQQFGMEQPLFINNIVNSLVSDNKGDEALAMVNEEIAKNPELPSLLGLRGFVYDRLGNNDASVNDYLAACALPNVDFETLKNASKKIFKVGTVLLNEVPDGPDARAAKLAIKEKYFDKALEYAEQARKLNPGDSNLLDVIDSIDYALQTYF